MTSRRRFASRALIAVTALALIPAIGQTPLAAASAPPASAPSAESSLRVVGRNWIELSPVLVAAESFYPGGLQVGSGGVTSITSGAADLATNAETQGLEEFAINPDLRLIMTVSESFYRLVARRSAGIETLADLEGKRIMVAPGTSVHYYVVAMLATVGLTEDDVEIVTWPDSSPYVAPMAAMSDALEDGEADALAIFEPESADAIDQLGDDAIVFQDRSVYRELFSLYADANALADPAKRADIVRFVRAVIDASAALDTAPEEHWLHISNEIGYTQRQIEGSWDEMAFPAGIPDDMLDVLVTEEPWVAAQDGREPRDRDELAGFLDPTVVEEALALDV